MTLETLLERSGLPHMKVQRLAQLGLLSDSESRGSGSRRSYDEADVRFCTILAHVGGLFGVASGRRHVVSNSIAIAIDRQLRFGLGRFLLIQEDGTVDRSEEIKMSEESLACAIVDLEAL